MISEENFKKNLDSIPFDNWVTTHQDEYVKEHKDELGDVDIWTKSFNKEAKKFRKACKKGVITKTKKGKLYTVLMKSGNQTVNFSFNVDKKGRLTSYLVNNVINYEFYGFK